MLAITNIQDKEPNKKNTIKVIKKRLSLAKVCNRKGELEDLAIYNYGKGESMSILLDCLCPEEQEEWKECYKKIYGKEF